MLVKCSIICLPIGIPFPPDRVNLRLRGWPLSSCHLTGWCKDLLAKSRIGHPVSRHKRSQGPIWVKNVLCECILDDKSQLVKVDSQIQVGYETAKVASGDSCEVEILCKEGQLEKVLLALLRMDEQGSFPSVHMYTSVLQLCTKRKALAEAKWVHAHLAKHGLECNRLLGDLVVITLVNCGSLGDGLEVFCRLPHRTVFSWTAIMSGYSRAGHCREALSCYESMQQDGVLPDKYTFVALLKACGKLADLDKGKRIHADAIRHGLDSDIFVGSTLVSMYAKCGSIVDAEQVFDGLSQRDIVSWNAMLTACSQQDHGNDCLQIYLQMQEEGVRPNARTFVSALQSCSTFAEKEAIVCMHGERVKVETLQKAREIHAEAARMGLDSDLFLGNSLLSIYAKCGSMKDAEQVFARLCECDLVSWTAMLAAYAQLDEGERALQIYQQMQKEGVIPDAMTFVSTLQACGNLAEKEDSKFLDGQYLKAESLQKAKEIYARTVSRRFNEDVFVGSTVISVYAKCGSINDAEEVFDTLSQRNLVSWNAMLAAYAQGAQGGKCLQMYQQMHSEGVKADEITFLCLIEACGNIGALETCVQIHHSIMQTQSSKLSLSVATSLIDAYSKCANMGGAQIVFDSLPQPDVVSWNALISGYSRLGDCERTVQLYEEMHLAGNKPDAITFLALLSACRHAGMVDKGLQYFDSMTKDHGIFANLEHHVCMIDLVCRAGLFSKAETLLSRLPVEPNWTIWISVLGACRKHGYVLLGRHAFDNAVSLEPGHAAAYVLMSNIYSHAGLWDSVKEIEDLRVAAGASKKACESWIEHEHELHTFLVAEQMHPQAALIHQTLKHLSSQLKEVQSI